MGKKLQIAIDGPVGVGKSSVAKKVAETLGYLYVDTGAMYRAVTLAAERNGCGMDEEAAIVVLIRNMNLEMSLPAAGEKDGRLVTVRINGVDVSHEIRSGSVNRDVPKVAALQGVRAALVPWQQRIAQNKAVVMEGRDITYNVLPQADLKIFLTAAVETRIERYWQSRTARERNLSRDEVAEWLKERDHQDWNRNINPLRIVPGVWVLDTTQMNLEEVVDKIIDRVNKL